MFCEKCGQANPDESKFCESCGAVLASEADTEAEGNSENFDSFGGVTPGFDEIKNNNLAKLIVTIAVPVIAIIIVALIIVKTGVFKSPAEKAMLKYLDAFYTQDEGGETVYKLSVDPYELENAIDYEYNDIDDEEDMIETFTDSADDRLDWLEDDCGEKRKLDVEIEVDKKYEKKDVEDVAEYLEDKCDYPAGALQDIVVLKVKGDVVGDEGDYNVKDYQKEYVVSKVDGNWYVGSVGEWGEGSSVYGADMIKDILKGEYDD